MARPNHGKGPQRHGRRRRRREKHLRLLRIQAKRFRRRLRRADSRERWRAKPWWARWPLEWAAVEQDVETVYPGFIRYRVGRALIYHGVVDLDVIPKQRRLTIVFPDRPRHRSPVVWSTGRDPAAPVSLGPADFALPVVPA